MSKRHQLLGTGMVAVLALVFIFTGLNLFAAPGSGMVKSYQKISDTEGGFLGTLDNGDGFGIGLEDIGDLNGDGVNDLVVGSWKDDDGSANYGAVYVLFMNTDGTVMSEEKISAISGGFTGALTTVGDFGASMGALGDLNGDGVVDIAIGERASHDGGTDRGSVWILFMNADGTVANSQEISDTEGGYTETLANFDLFGSCVRRVADVNGDGVGDLVVCTPQDDEGGADRGTLHVLYLNTDGTVSGFHRINDLEGGFSTPLDDVDKFASSMAVIGDLNGDGIDDWVVGAPLDDDGGSNRGAVYILFMNADGTVASEAKISAQTENFTQPLGDEDRFGAAVDAMGDVDEDGVPDIVVGAWNDDDGGSNRGAAYVIFLEADGGVKSYQKISDLEGGFEGELNDNDSLGFQLASIGDLNGDTITDLALGAFSDDDGGDGRGAVWVAFLDRVRMHQEEDPVIYPVNTSFTINNGATCTASRDVQLELVGNHVKDVVIGNDPEFLDGVWESFTASPMSRNWTLSEGDGQKTVYVRYRSCSMNQSYTIARSIVLDTVGKCSSEYVPEETDVIITEPEYEIPEITLPDTAISPLTGLAEPVSDVKPGDVIRTPSSSTVYYVDARMVRHPFLNQATYFTWYDSFDTVKIVTDATIAVLPPCTPMSVRPESVLVKLAGDKRVYWPVEDAGIVVWRWITTEDLAEQVFGREWASYILEFPATMFPHVTIGEDIDETTEIQVDRKRLMKREELGS